MKALKRIIVILLMLVSALSGVYTAKKFTTPYSQNIVEQFHSETLDEVEISKEKCNILVMGTDKSGSLTDVMILVQINPETEKVNVMSIPRDTRVKYKGSWIKINSAHYYGKKSGTGSEASIIAVKELTGIPINHFVKINFDAFSDTVDELGGVDFNVPQRMKYSDPYQDLYIDLQKGMQHLDGDKAEQLIRFRRYVDGDLGRIKVQQDFLHALIEQKLKVKYVGKVGSIYKIIARNMETSMTPDDFVQGASQVLDIGGDNVNTYTLPNVPQYIDRVSYVVPVTSEIKKIREEVFGYDESGNEIPVSSSQPEAAIE